MDIERLVRQKWRLLNPEAMPLAAVLARNPASRVARWRPGSRFSYANPGYTVAAYILEKITGRPYEEVVERELFADRYHVEVITTPTRARHAISYVLSN